MKHEVLIGQTDYTVLVKIRDDAGAPATGLTEASIDIAYARVETDNDVTTTDVTPAALSALTDAHTDWGFEEVSATDHPGVYRLDIADAVFASGAWSAVVSVTGTGLDPADLEFVLVAFNPRDGVRLGLTALPNAAADAAGGLPISDAGGLDLDAQIGTDIDAILVDTAEIGVAGAGLTAINLPNQTMDIVGNITGNLSGSVGSVTGAVGSVTGAVGSVTGAVGSVTGSVGSVATGGITSGSFAAGALDAVWSVATRTLTAFDSSFKTGYALSAAGVQAIWDALTSALTTVSSIGKLLVDNINATISSRSSHSAADVWSSATRTLTAATNITSTGGTTVPQTGDSFARLGAPAGASVSADIAAIEAQTDDIGAAGAGLTAIPWSASWDTEVESEALDALNTILADSIPADGTLPTARQALYMLVQLLTESAVSGTTLTIKKSDGSTTLFQLTLNDATTPTSITRSS